MSFFTIIVFINGDIIVELEILMLIYDYSIKRKIANSKFIEKLIEIVVIRKNLNNYVKSIIFTNDLSIDNCIVSSAYNALEEEILVNYESLCLLVEKRCNECSFKDLEYYMFKNLIVVQIVLHELEHAKQCKQAFNDYDNSIQAKLIRTCFAFEQIMKNPEFLSSLNSGKISLETLLIYEEQDRKLYKKYYRFDPSERLAQYNSFKTIVDIIEPIKKNILKLYEFKKVALVKEMLKGYKESWDKGKTCPTQFYLEGTGNRKIWTDFDFYSRYSKKLIKNVCEQYNFTRRLSLGLPINNKEYERAEEWLKMNM